MRIFTGAEKDAAHEAVSRAIRNGQLNRPANCEHCQANAQLFAHHDDYSKQLDVMWLCRRCHTDRHGAIHQAEKAYIATRRPATEPYIWRPQRQNSNSDIHRIHMLMQAYKAPRNSQISLF